MAATAKRGPGRPRKNTAAENLTTQDEPTIIPIDPEPEEEENRGVSEADVIADEPVEAQVTNNDLAKAVVALAKGQEALHESQVRRVPYANFKPRSRFNPTGNKKRRLKRRVYQNGVMVNIVTLTDKEIELLNIVKGGNYIPGEDGNALVSIRLTQKGANDDLHIFYKNKTIDDKLANKSEWRNFGQLLQRCIDEGPVVVE